MVLAASSALKSYDVVHSVASELFLPGVVLWDIVKRYCSKRLAGARCTEEMQGIQPEHINESYQMMLRALCKLSRGATRSR